MNEVQNAADHIYSLAGKVLDRMPSMVFLMDEFPMIVGMNNLAKSTVGIDNVDFYQKRCGELLQCVNATEKDSCSTTHACETCPIRDVYAQVQKTGEVVKKRAEMAVFGPSGEQLTKVFIVTAYKIEAKKGGIITLILDDISELLQIRSFIPICTSCKKIKDENQTWKKLEDYFRLQGEMIFSHCLCPDCFSKVCPDESI